MGTYEGGDTELRTEQHKENDVLDTEI